MQMLGTRATKTEQGKVMDSLERRSMPQGMCGPSAAQANMASTIDHVQCIVTHARIIHLLALYPPYYAHGQKQGSEVGPGEGWRVGLRDSCPAASGVKGAVRLLVHGWRALPGALGCGPQAGGRWLTQEAQGRARGAKLKASGPGRAARQYRGSASWQDGGARVCLGWPGEGGLSLRPWLPDRTD